MPWIGFFDLIDQVDKFVFLDNVQIQKRYWDVRNRIKSSSGELYLTIPIKKTESRDDTLFTNAKISYDVNWISKHLLSIKHCYVKTEYFKEVYSLLENVLEKNHVFLSELNINIIESIRKYLNIGTSTMCSSDLNYIDGSKDLKLVNICKTIGAKTYLSPLGSSNYIESSNVPGGEFALSKIKLYYQNYSPPIYNQLHGGFISHLSVIDLLFNCGSENSLKLLRSGRMDHISSNSIRDKKFNE